MVGKPNQTIPRAPLKPISAFEEPFSRVLIDCVGPLPKSKSGNEYLLTIMFTSRSISLRNIKTKTTVKALIKFFLLWLVFQNLFSLIKVQILYLVFFNKLMYVRVRHTSV